MKNLVVGCLLLVFLFPMLVKGQSKQACRLSLEGTVQHPSCQGGMDGAIALQVKGGKAPYTYHWNSGHETEGINQLTAGTYRVTVQDSEGCQATATYVLKAEEKALGLQVAQKATVGGKVLQLNFAGNAKPVAVYIKDLSEGFRAPQNLYSGEVLKSGTYLLEAFTAAGCSVSERIKIEAN
jgi:hypothetical protein